MHAPQPGSFAKVHLPGESPWAECQFVNPDGTWVGRIDNYLFGQMTDAEREAVIAPAFGEGRAPLPRLHSYKQHDLIIFRLESTPDFEIWVPLEQQGRA